MRWLELEKYALHSPCSVDSKDQKEIDCHDWKKGNIRKSWTVLEFVLLVKLSIRIRKNTVKLNQGPSLNPLSKAIIDTEDETVFLWLKNYLRLFYLSPWSASIYLTESTYSPVSSATCTHPRKLSQFHCFQDCIFHSAEVHRDSTQAAGFLNENILTGKESCSAQLQNSNCQENSTNAFWKNSDVLSALGNMLSKDYMQLKQSYLDFSWRLPANSPTSSSKELLWNKSWIK